MKIKRYKVGFIVKQNRSEVSISMEVIAKKAKEAIEIVKDNWYETHTQHMFRPNAVLVKEVIV